MTLPIGATLVPVLFASDATHLTNFSSDGIVWPLYMSIGNIKSVIRNRPTSHMWIPVALLPNSPKRVKKITGWSKEKQEQEAIEVLPKLLIFILHLLSDVAWGGLGISCWDGIISKCHLRVAGWLADHMENSTIHGIYSTQCPICECPQEELSNLQKYPPRKAEKYWAWVNESDAKGLHNDRVKPVTNCL